MATSPGAKHSRGRPARGGEPIGDDSAVNRPPMPRSDASQGSSKSARHSRAGACGSHLGRSAFRVQRVARLVAFACVAAIAVLSLVPGAERPNTGLPGRAEHFIAYAGTGFFVALGYVGWRYRLIAWIGLAAASGLFEILQNFVPGRSPSLFDALASTGGLTCGMAFGAVLAAALTGSGRADATLGADRGAAFWRALPFSRRRRRAND